MGNREWIGWSCEEAPERITATTRDEAIEEYLDMAGVEALDEIETLYATSYSPVAPTQAEVEAEELLALDGLLERLDEEHGDPDEATEPTPAMREAARVFVAAVLAEYRVFNCQEVSRERVNVREWITEHRPDWLAAAPRPTQEVESEP